jgi:AcrR family transcriptional regulator
VSAETDTGRVTARSEQAAETRQRLLEAAIELFSEQNFDDVAVADIARSAGVAHGLLFHYFGNKRGIYLESMRAGADQMSANFELRPGVPPGRQIRDALKKHFEYLAAHRGFALRLVLAGRGVDPEAWEVFESRRRNAVAWLLELLEIEPTGDAMRMMGRAFAGAIDATAAHWLESGQPFNVDAVVESLIHIAVAAVRAAARLDPNVEGTEDIEAILFSDNAFEGVDD